MPLGARGRAADRHNIVETPEGSIWRRRSGVSARSGSSAATSLSDVHSSCSSSGTTFSPSTRFAKITLGSLACSWMSRAMTARRHAGGSGDRRHAGERKLQRYGAGRGQRHARLAKRRPFFPRSTTDARRHRPPGNSLAAVARRRGGPCGSPDRSRDMRRKAGDVSPKNAGKAADLARPAARQGQH